MIEKKLLIDDKLNSSSFYHPENFIPHVAELIKNKEAAEINSVTRKISCFKSYFLIKFHPGAGVVFNVGVGYYAKLDLSISKRNRSYNNIVEINLIGEPMDALIASAYFKEEAMRFEDKRNFQAQLKSLKEETIEFKDKK